MMTIKQVKALLTTPGTRFFLKFSLNSDHTESIQISKVYVQNMIDYLDDDYEMKCTDWEDKNYLLG